MRKPTIVIVEAYSPMGLLLDELFTEEGYQIRLWPDSTSAFEFIRHEHPDLVILNLSLQRRGDGLAVLDKLGRDPATSDIPVVVFVDDSYAISMMGVLPTARRSEALEKRFHLDQLIARVRRLVEQPRVTLDGSRENTAGQREAALIGGFCTPH